MFFIYAIEKIFVLLSDSLVLSQLIVYFRLLVRHFSAALIL